MGRGTIISGGTGGQYQLQINYDRVAYNAELAKLATQITEWSTKISDKTAEIIVLENEYAALVVGGFLPEVLAAKQKEITAAEKEKATLSIYKLSFEKRKQYLQDNMPADEAVLAWCADLTENLTGSVGTVEVPGEPPFIQIQPGYDGNAVYDGTRDGVLTPAVIQTPTQVFYNLCMLPGWQKWKPLFRYATITAIDGDTASISLDNILSSQQALEINQSSTIAGVAINYMDCNGAAFQVGDEVLVKFTGQVWGNPVIVGFKTDPVLCCIFSDIFRTGDYDHVWTYASHFAAATIGTGTWIVEDSWTESISGSADKLNLDFTYTGGTNYFIVGSTTYYSTNGAFSYGYYAATLSQISLPGTYLIVDLSVSEISQSPYSYGTAANRAKLDIMITVGALDAGVWYTRYAALRFNVDSTGFFGVFAADLYGYLSTEYSWAEEFRIVEDGVYIAPKFEQVNYPPVPKPTSPTAAISARIKADINYIKICGSAPDGATIGDIINPTNATAVSF